MLLDTAEVERISERLGALGNRSKLLASYIAVQATDSVICSEMGVRPHEINAAVSELCTELHMTYLDPPSWRTYVRAAVLLVASPTPTSLPPPKSRVRLKLSPKAKAEVELIIAGFLRASKRTTDPLLAAMLSATPRLLAYAISLCGNVGLAEELLQEGLSRAYANLHSFQPGANLKANMRAWLFTIVRNHFQSELRKRRYEIEDVEGSYAETLECLPDQIALLELKELSTALDKLPEDQRQALVLVGASGYSYEEAADICHCAVGTIKSRVNRARTRIAELLGVEAGDEGPGGMFLAHGASNEEETA